MFSIKTMNKISSLGLDLLPRESFEVASEIPDPDGILVRSADLHGMELSPRLKAIARAGAGYNNIPVDACTERGIVVFNTPGANANAVKELVLCSLLMSSRKVVSGITWAKSLIGKGDEVPNLVEKGKAQFTGPEIKGKRLGVIGLGAIGALVANDAVSLGMNVIGFDPFISVESAWGLSRLVSRARGLESLLSESDYITLHLPLTDSTKGMLDSERFTQMKPGVRIMNFARGGLVNNAALIKAIAGGVVDSYVTDFPDEELLKVDRVIGIPHLGASTPEAEDNCAIMAVQQIANFLERGNIKNSVNFPACDMELSGESRIVIANRNVPNMVGQITTVLAKEGINISEMLNRHQDDFAFNIIDIEDHVDPSVVDKLRGIEGIIMARLIPMKEG